MSYVSTTIEFTERMSGHFVAKKMALTSQKTLLRQDFNHLSDSSIQHPFEFTLTVKVPDLESFIKNPSQTIPTEGRMTDFRFKNLINFDEGSFKLVSRPEVSSDLCTAQEMHYTMFMTDDEGKKWTFFGFKELLKEDSFKMWAQTTTLYFYIWSGHSNFESFGVKDVQGVGELKISTQDFIKQLLSFKTNDKSFLDEKKSIASFMQCFAENLWTAYAPFIFTTTSKRWNEHYYPVQTTQGVAAGTTSLYSLDTLDGLTISLQRFETQKQKDVILLLHGLTTSTDMFIMPEHKNLVNTLHENGFGDVWSLDWRGSGRFTYNLQPHKYTIDDVANYDIPAAINLIKEKCGEDVRIHVIAHCVGSLSFMAAFATGKTRNIASIICNSVSLTPQVKWQAKAKMMIGPELLENLKYPYISPRMPYYPGKSFGKWLYWMERSLRSECKEPACHMISFMWGWGFPAAFNHRNIHPVTHRRLADLFGGTSLHYHKHIRKMLLKKASVSFADGRDEINYLEEFKRRDLPPLLLISGAENHIFPNSNKRTFELLKAERPFSDIRYQEFMQYGHQDVFMGQYSDQEVFPTLISFLKEHAITEAKPITKLTLVAG